MRQYFTFAGTDDHFYIGRISPIHNVFLRQQMCGGNHHGAELMKGDDREPELITAFKDKHHLIAAPDTEPLEIRCRLIAVSLHVGKREVKVFAPVVRPAQGSFLRSLVRPCVDHIVAVIKMFRYFDMEILLKIFLRRKRRLRYKAF